MTRRRILPYALGAAALVAVALACSQAGTPQPGGISGTYDMARVGDYVFVTSADLSELRVIDAHGDGGPNGAGPRDWVRAPNPLQALEIPVDGRPVGLVKDLRYTDVAVDDVTPAGGEVAGPYVYAFAGGRSQISVVGADPAIFRQVQVLPTGAPVTAASAQGPSGAGASSTLYYATLMGGAGQLWAVDVPPTAQLNVPEPPALSPRMLLQMDAGEAISALQVLPTRQELAVATRAALPDGGVVTGRTFALLPSSGATRPLAFGAPIRILATHPGTSDGRFRSEEKLFGVVDEDSCGGGGAPNCARILTVDVASGQPALDFTGQAALPIPFPRGLPRALTFMANRKVRSNLAPLDAGGLADLPLVGLVTNTDGELVFFEAVGRPVLGTEPVPDDGGLPDVAPQWTLRHSNQEFLPGVGTGFFYEDAGGAAFPTLPPQAGCGEDAGVGQGLQQCSVRTGLGTAVAEQVTILFEGRIPDLIDVFDMPMTPADEQTFHASGKPVSRAMPGARIVLSTAAGTCGEVSMTSISGTDLMTTDPIPPGCTNRTSFTVRAADPEPYVVLGQFSGYIGRIGDQASRDFPGTPYYRPDPVVSGGVIPPALRLEMGIRTAGIQRDFRWVFQTSTGFQPLFFSLSTDPTTGWPGYHLPYGVAAMPDAPRIFVSYPSVPRTPLLGTGAVIELNPTLMVPSEANVQIGAFYR
ncbi:MAG TPA: hypothetical protein VIG99_09180 [Myxococcaceae bacterium]